LKIKRVATLKSQVHWLKGLEMRWHGWHIVAVSSHDGHMTLEGSYIPKAMGVCSDWGYGHNFGCDRKRPMRPSCV